jgi:apolipoprotein N-acyltransferase
VASIKAALVRLGAVRGFLGFLVAALIGALGVLGHAPFHIWPAFGVSICGLFVLLDGAAKREVSGVRRARAGFGAAWSWAFGYFFAGMFWVGDAFLVDADKFAVLMPFAVSALPAGLAVFWGIGGAVALSCWRPHASRLLVFTLAFGVVEYARGHLLTGLPWNLPAYIWRAGEAISQNAALIGPYTLSALTLFLFASPVVLLSAATRRESTILASSVLLAVALMFGYGAIRLHNAGPVDPMKGSGPIIAAGQGGYSQREVWDPANANRVTQTYLDLLESEAAKKADIVVWPEGTFPFLLLEQPDVLDVLGAKLGDRTLVLGSIRRDQSRQGSVYSNSILAFDVKNTSLTLRSAYDKFHLVPFGEYLPFRPIFKALGIASLVSYDGEMTPGPAPSNMSIEGAPLADPRVCYEIVFPSFNRGAVGKAKWILNVSIDAWFGDLLGPDQHYAQARMRAIETGRPLVRAASGGWSSITDKYGRALAEHHFGAGYAVARLPLDGATTPYDQFGDRIFGILLAFMLVFVLICRHRSVDFIVQVNDETR